MAEQVLLRNLATSYPCYGIAYAVVFPLLDSGGDPISPSSPDSEVSKNGDTFTDCTNEAVEIATSSGICYLLLTATEMTADVVAVRIQSSGAKTTVLTLLPRKLVVLTSGTCQGSTGTGNIQLASGEVNVDNYYNGCLCVAVIDGTTEARIINGYTGSTKTGTVTPAWNTAQPDSDDTYTIYLPEGRQVNVADVRAFGSMPGAFSGGVPTVFVGTGGISFASFATGAITASAFAANAITDAAVAADVTIASVTGAVGSVTGAVGSVTGNVGGSVASIASGGIVAASFAANAITDAAVASDVTIASVTGAVGSVAGNVVGNVTGTIGGLTTAALAGFFTANSGTTYASAISGSVVKEIVSNAVGGSSFDTESEDSESYGDSIRLMRSVLAGETDGVVSGTKAYKSKDGTKTRVSGDITNSGSRANITTDPS